MKKDELIRILEKAKTPCLPEKEVLQCERKFVYNNFQKLVRMQIQHRRRRFAFALASVVIAFFLVFGSAAFSGYVEGTPPFLSIFGRYIYFARQNDTVVAWVNRAPIYLSNVADKYFMRKESYEFHKKYYGEQFAGPAPMPMDILNNLINERLIMQYMKKKGYKLYNNGVSTDMLFNPQKEWFNYEVQGDVPNGTYLDPIARKYFKEKSKIIRDAVNHSNLTKDEFFDKVMVPELEADEYLLAFKENTIESISVPEPTEKEIEQCIKTHSKGFITFAKLAFSSKAEEEKALASFKKKSSPCFAMLDAVTEKNPEKPLTKFTFKNPDELPEIIKKGNKEFYLLSQLKDNRIPYLFEVKYNNKYYIVCIFNYQSPRYISKGEAISIIEREEKKKIAEKKISQLEQELRENAKIQIANKEAVENLAHMH